MIAIEICGNRNLYFAPLGRRLRGDLDLSTLRGNDDLKSRFPNVIPGVTLLVDPSTKTAKLIDRLHDDSASKEAIERIPKRLPPQEETFEGIDVPTYLDRMQRAVKAGVARLVSGKFPTQLPGKPRDSFIRTDEPDTTTALVEALNRQTEAFEKLADVLQAKS